MNRLFDFYQKLDMMTVDSTRVKAAPFPGRYPTRWRLLVIGSKNEILFNYVGKPNPKLIPKLLRIVNRINGGAILLNEFDRLGPFRQSWRYPPQDYCTSTTWRSVVNQVYYPWSAFHEFFGPWSEGKVYFKRLRMGRKTFAVYSPYPTMTDEVNIERLRTTRAWLNKNKPWK